MKPLKESRREYLISLALSKQMTTKDALFNLGKTAIADIAGLGLADADEIKEAILKEIKPVPESQTRRTETPPPQE